MLAVALVIGWLFLFIRYRFWRQATSITVLLLALTHLGSSLSNFKFYKEYVDPGNEEVDPYNVLISQRNYIKQDNLVVVNFGSLSRGDIARQIAIISRYKPKLIGIDGFFNCEGGLRDSLNCPQLLDTAGNRMLANAIADAGNIIMISALRQKRKTALVKDALDVYDSMEFSDPAFMKNAGFGYSNIITTNTSINSISEANSFVPTVMFNGQETYAFATEISFRIDPTKTTEFLERRDQNDRESNKPEVINFRFNLDDEDLQLISNKKESSLPLLALDVEDVFNENFRPDQIRDKIVLIGYMGDYFGEGGWRDKFYTSLNKRPWGRAVPDMYSIILHANIISMILNRDYIDEQSQSDSLVINFWICLLHISLLLLIRQRWSRYFDVFATIIIIAQIVLFTFLRKELFYIWNYRLFFGVSVASLAIAGLVINIYFEIVPQIDRYTLKITPKWMRKIDQFIKGER